MIFVSEKQKKIDSLYTKLQDLKEGKRIVERAMHYSYYNRETYSNLFNKLNKILAQIEETKKEINKEKEESRTN